jgi:hypothetical protein
VLDEVASGPGQVILGGTLEIDVRPVVEPDEA